MPAESQEHNAANEGGGVFDNIDDVIPKAERDEFMARYKQAAGFAIEALNAAPSIIAAGARVGRG